ncbi:MAG: hypothetical protein IJE63_00745 [Clostridia bacterium]|nr:hypothetical protein [Clostridia bacterium]
MKSFNKRSVFSFVLCAMLVFCIGVYSSAEPTTAWFSDSGEDSETYKMEELNVSFSGDRMGENETVLELKFDAATKFDDADERANMFEHAAKYYVFSAKNNNPVGGLDAAVSVNISYSNTQDDVMTAAEIDKGLRYFIYEIDTASDIGTMDTELVPGVWVDADDNCLIKPYENNDDLFYDSKLADRIEEKIALETGFESFTPEQKLSFLNDIQETTDKLEPGNEKTYCVCFWVEYDAFVDQSQAIENSAVRELVFDVDVKISAEQYDKTVLAAE